MRQLAADRGKEADPERRPMALVLTALPRVRPGLSADADRLVPGGRCHGVRHHNSVASRNIPYGFSERLN